MTASTTQEPSGVGLLERLRVPRYVAALGFIAVIGVLVGLMVWTAFGFSSEARVAPLVVGAPTVFFIVIQLVRDTLRVRKGDVTVGMTSDQERDRYASTPHVAPVSASPTEVATEARTTISAAPAAPGAKVGADHNTPLWAALLWLLTLAVSVYLVGMIVTIPVYIALFMRIFGRERWSLIVAYALGMSAAVYVIFVVVLEVRLYRGIFGALLP